MIGGTLGSQRKARLDGLGELENRIKVYHLAHFADPISARTVRTYQPRLQHLRRAPETPTWRYPTQPS